MQGSISMAIQLQSAAHLDAQIFRDVIQMGAVVRQLAGVIGALSV